MNKFGCIRLSLAVSGKTREYSEEKQIHLDTLVRRRDLCEADNVCPALPQRWLASASSWVLLLAQPVVTPIPSAPSAGRPRKREDW